MYIARANAPPASARQRLRRMLATTSGCLNISVLTHTVLNPCYVFCAPASSCAHFSFKAYLIFLFLSYCICPKPHYLKLDKMQAHSNFFRNIPLLIYFPPHLKKKLLFKEVDREHCQNYSKYHPLLYQCKTNTKLRMHKMQIPHRLH